jgi:serine/threonine protein kinase
LSQCANSFARSPPTDVSAALKAVVDPAPLMIWEEQSKIEATKWQQWLNNPPPCPISLKMGNFFGTASHQQGDLHRTPRSGSPSASMPWSLTAATPTQQLASPWNPAERLDVVGVQLEDYDQHTPRKSRTPPKNVASQRENEITPRKLVCSRDSTPPPTRRSSPPTTKRSSPPISISRRSPLFPTPSSQTPALRLNYGLLDEVESPWKLPKVDGLSEDESSPLSMRWPPSPLVSCPWAGDLDTSLSPASRLGLKDNVCEDQENRDPNIGRFHREFQEVTPIKKGKFATVYRAAHKMDRQSYAVTAQHAVDDMEQQVLLREVVMIAAVCTEGPVCPNVLQYYSAWMEDASLHVQTELYECSLRDRLVANRQLSSSSAVSAHRSKSEETLHLLRDMASGLASLHAHGLAHTDVRPETILVTAQGHFKIGGLGRCTRLSVLGPPPIPVGDECATDHYYRAPEALWLGGEYSELPKADVFSSALVVCEFAMCPAVVPSDSCEWQQLRSGCLREAIVGPYIPDPLLLLLRRMLTSDPSDRPACKTIADHVTELQLAADQSLTLQSSRGLSEAELISSLRKQREEHLRESLRCAIEEEEMQRKRAEAARLELEALKRKVAQRKEVVSRPSDLERQRGQCRPRCFSSEPAQRNRSNAEQGARASSIELA